jgi:hypothetical protein
MLWDFRIKENKIQIIRKRENNLFLEENVEKYKYLGIKINVDEPHGLGIQTDCIRGDTQF